MHKDFRNQGQTAADRHVGEIIILASWPIEERAAKNKVFPIHCQIARSIKVARVGVDIDWLLVGQAVFGQKRLLVDWTHTSKIELLRSVWIVLTYCFWWRYIR